MFGQKCNEEISVPFDGPFRRIFADAPLVDMYVLKTCGNALIVCPGGSGKAPLPGIENYVEST